MILVLDNRDSFVHNLARYVAELGETAVVRRSDRIDVGGVESLGPSHIIISAGPCTPVQAGVSTEVVRVLGGHIPILGVCLGAQCIGAAYGARIVRARRPVHGKVTRIHHRGTGVLEGVPSPFLAARYNSLVIEREALPPELEVVAVSDEDEIMAVSHREAPVYGVQFHPESAATEYGYWILRRFLTGGASARVLPMTADLGVTRTPTTAPVPVLAH